MASETPSPSEIVLERLRQLVERRSTSAEISRQLEQPDNWLAKFFNRELRFELGRVEKVLKVLDLPLRWFLDWCFEDYPESEPQRVLTLLCPDAKTAPDPFLDDLRPRLSLLLTQLEADTSQVDPKQMPEPVAIIDQLRFSDRAAAKTEIEAHLELLVASDSLPETLVAEIAAALAVWAAIQRTSDRQADAGTALSLALDISGRFRLGTTTALLLQRSHYLLRDWGEPHQALLFIERALIQFACLGCQHDVGKCLVDRGSLYLHLHDERETITSCTEALRLLPESEWRNRSSAFLNIAEAELRLGDLEPALAAVDTGLGLLAISEHDVCRGHACWIKARVFQKTKNNLAAADCFRQALDHLINGGGMPVDIALVALSLAKVHLREGDLKKLRQLTEQIQAISPAIRTSPAVDRVLMEFVVLGRYGQLSAASLSRSIGELESAAQDRSRLRSGFS